MQFSKFRNYSTERIQLKMYTHIVNDQNLSADDQIAVIPVDKLSEPSQSDPTLMTITAAVAAGPTDA